MLVEGKTMPVVSVVIPAYNAEDYICQCLESVKNQTLADIEIVLVDDGSTDATARLASEMFEGDDRFTLIYQDNRYAGVARNVGIDSSSGDYLYFLDADDWIESSALESMYEAAVRFSSDIVVACSEGFDEQTGNAWTIDYALNGVPFLTPLSAEIYADRLFQNFMGWPWDKLYRREFIESSGLRFQSLRTTNDAFFVFCSLAVAGCVVCLNETFFHHRMNNSKSLEGTRSESWRCAIEAMTAIKAKLKGLSGAERLLSSYDNWVLNYSLWTIRSLPKDIGEAFLDEVHPILQEMPDIEGRYPGIQERAFWSLAMLSCVELLDRAVSYRCENEELLEALSKCQYETERLREEVRQRDEKIREIYSSSSYKAGHVLLLPLSKAKSLAGLR